jgi:two-component system, OmpR family, aerobic respiration control sensor histidine kinase ArcB
MLGVKTSVEFFFGVALFINALLYIPQALKIFREKTAKSISLSMFIGFFLIQFAILLHGLMNHDYLLTAGYLLSMVTCGCVVALTLFYEKRDKASSTIDISFQDILEQLPGHIYWKNKEGVHLGCNYNNCKDFGVKSLSDAKGKTDYDLFSKSEADQLKILDQEVMRTGQLRVMEEPLTIAGKTNLYLSHKVPLKNKYGEIIGILGTSLDITDSKKEVMEQLNMLENIIAVMPGNVYWMNKQGVYLGCNDNEAKSVGLTARQEIVGKRNIDISGFVIPEFLDEVNKKVMESGDLIVAEEPAVLQNGTKATFLSSKVPLHNQGGEVMGMVGISIDITDRKNSEEALKAAKKMAEAANEAKTQFLCNMQHDLRTPFSGILGLSEFMESKETDLEKKENLSMISQSAQALLEQLNEIFEFVKVESGQLPILDKEFDIRCVLNEVFSMLLPSAKSKQLEFTLTIADALPQFVVGDRVRTQRVLMNLIANAIKFTQEGYIKFEAKVASQENMQLVVSFVIQDTGIGIPENKQNIIFERFNRLTSAYSSMYAGKGLGLRIVKQFLDDINGQSHLESEVGKGSIFKILIPYRLPLLKELDVETISQSANLKKRSTIKKQSSKIENSDSNYPKENKDQVVNHMQFSSTKKNSILLVEDHPIAAKISGSILSDLGCQVDIAEDGKTALEWVEKKFYDLIFMDIGLPGMSGYEVARRIRSNNIRSIAQIPIVALTAHADGDNKQHCIDVSMNTVVTKPLRKQQAQSILDAFIMQRKKYVEKNKAEKVVDFEYAKKLLGGDESVIFEALEMLVGSFPLEVEKIQAAYQEKNWEKLQAIAHKLQGGSSYCGTLRLKSVCSELEDYIESGLTARIPELYGELLVEIDALVKFMVDRGVKV